MGVGIPAYNTPPGMGALDGSSGYVDNSGSGSAHEVADTNAYGYVDGKIPGWVASDAADAKGSGKMTRGEFDAWRLEQQSAREAREYERMLADSAWQRKVADLQKAGFSPLAALDATGQGAAVPTAQVAKASGSGSDMNLGSVIGAIVAAVALIASKGAAAASSAKNAVALEGIKQGNRKALANFYVNAAKDRAKYSAKAAMARATIKKGRVINKGPYGYIEDIYYGL